MCGGHLTATTQFKHFYSHAKFGDFNYDSQADCDWVIEAEAGRNVQLTFLTFDVRKLYKYILVFLSLYRIVSLKQLEDEKSCSYDFVDVYGGLDDYSGPLYGRYCGNNVCDVVFIIYGKNESVNINQVTFLFSPLVPRSPRT